MHVCVCLLSRFSRVQLFATLWTVACQDPLSIQFFRQECWSELPSPLPRDLPDPGIEPPSLMSAALAGGFFATSATWELEVHYSAYTYLRIFSIFSFVVEDILRIVSVLSHYLTAQTMVYPGKCSSCTWKEYVSCYCWVECSINVN